MNGKYNISPDFDIIINLMESQLSKTTTQGEQLKQFQTINEMGRMLFSYILDIYENNIHRLDLHKIYGCSQLVVRLNFSKYLKSIFYN